MAHDSQYRRMIRSARWQKLRNLVLSRNPICVQCEKEGRLALAQEVHHRVPVDSVHSPAERERLMFDPDNLMPLCRACHLELHRVMKKGTKEEHQRRLTGEIKGIIDDFF